MEYINKADMWEACENAEDYADMVERFGILPTVDIVRCGECKHGRSYFVNRWACEHPQHKKQWHNTNWFCADGERKSDDWYL